MKYLMKLLISNKSIINILYNINEKNIDQKQIKI